MTKTEELINEVLKLDADATKGDWYWYATSPSTRSVLSKVGSRSEIISSGSYNTDAELIAAYRSAAPILAKMLRVAVDNMSDSERLLTYFGCEIEREADELECGGEECEMHCSLMDSAANVRTRAQRLRDALTELDRIVAEGLGEK